MTSRSPAFKKTDIKKAVAAVQEAGLPVSGIVLDPASGTITIQTSTTKGQQLTPLDAWKASHERSA